MEPALRPVEGSLLEGFQGEQFAAVSIEVRVHVKSDIQSPGTLWPGLQGGDTRPENGRSSEFLVHVQKTDELGTARATRCSDASQYSLPSMHYLEPTGANSCRLLKSINT